MPFTDHARRLIVWIASLSVWYKLFIGTILGAIGGSTVVGVLNTYAIYSYAYWHGSRIPVEGVPYLGLAVTIVSFAFLVSSLTCATVVYGFLALLTALLRRFFSWVIAVYRKLRQDDDRLVPHVAKSLISAFAGMGSAITALIPLFSGIFSSAKTVDWLHVNVPMRAMIIGAASFVVIVTVLAVWQRLVKWFAVVLTVALIATTVVEMFRPSVYGHFLRTIKYGGGTSVKVTYNDPDDRFEEYEGYLFLVTSKVYILYDDNKKLYVEIPADNVTRIRYSVNAVHMLPPVAPQSPVTPNDG